MQHLIAMLRDKTGSKNLIVEPLAPLSDSDEEQEKDGPQDDKKPNPKRIDRIITIQSFDHESVPSVDNDELERMGSRKGKFRTETKANQSLDVNILESTGKNETEIGFSEIEN